MLLKIMSDENLPDDDSRKSFFLYAGVKQVQFYRVGYAVDGSSDGKPTAAVVMDDGEELDLPMAGNAYVMNDSGKTIASFGVAGPHHLRQEVGPSRGNRIEGCIFEGGSVRAA